MDNFLTLIILISTAIFSGKILTPAVRGEGFMIIYVITAIIVSLYGLTKDWKKFYTLLILEIFAASRIYYGMKAGMTKFDNLYSAMFIIFLIFIFSSSSNSSGNSWFGGCGGGGCGGCGGGGCGDCGGE